MKKRILILGIDGYIGYPLAIHLLENDYEVYGFDNLSRRQRVKDIGSNSLTPIVDYQERRAILETYEGFKGVSIYDIHGDYFYIRRMLEDIQPHTVVHLAEQPSASWSMYSAHQCIKTQYENVIGTLNILWALKDVCPKAHLLKLGTMGEYGKPNCDIPEGEIEDWCCSNKEIFLDECPMAGLPFPRSPNSFYHLSKVHDTHNIIFACKNWGLSSTDIMQGIVFGLSNLSQFRLTRFDYDEYFGTVINRFCAQAIIEHPLTVYGSGHQTYSFLPLKDSIQCLTLAINNPPKQGEYRVFNQFESLHSINQLANMVAKVAIKQGLHATIQHISNPRKEAENHYYNPAHEKLFNLGYTPTTDIQGEINNLIKTLYPYRSRINKSSIMPKTKWE